MPKVKNVEKKIWDVEGFDVCIKKNGKDVRGDKKGLPQFKAEKASRNSWTVAEWKRKKFDHQYPGYEIDVLDADGCPVTGGKTLGKLRDDYYEEED